MRHQRDETATERKQGYLAKLRDPRWQKMRLKILERDGWTCQICLDTASTLHVHHRYYSRETEPWDYPAAALVTLCEECHTTETAQRRLDEESLLHVLRKRGFFCKEIVYLTCAFDFMQPDSSPELIVNMIDWVLQDASVIAALREAYFAALAQRGHRGVLEYFTEQQQAWEAREHDTQ